MKSKKIRIIPPLTALIIMLLDVGAVLLFVFGILSVIHKAGVTSFILIVISAINFFAAVKTTMDAFGSGVIFNEKSVEFTCHDNDNRYYYKNILKVETHKDTKASFKKNFTQRYSSVILFLDDGDTATVELGFTSAKTLKKIKEEIEKRL